MLKRGTYAYELLLILAVVGEYPRRCLSLLGQDRMLKRIVNNGKGIQEIRLESGEVFHSKLFIENGKGASKSVRLHKNALEILRTIDNSAYEYYEKTYAHHFAKEKVSRKHRVAEGVALIRAAGIEYRPHVLPRLQNKHRCEIIPMPSFYLARDMKAIVEDAINKTAYARLIGGLFTEERSYAVYNARDSEMKWAPHGEYKAKDLCSSVGQYNAGLSETTSAIMLGCNLSTVLRILEKPRRDNKESFRLDRIYRDTYYIPTDSNGIKLLRILVQRGWKRIILTALFPKSMLLKRPIDRECDAIIDGKYILSLLDCNIARLQRLKETIGTERISHDRNEHEIVCYDFQADAISEHLEDMATVRPVSIEDIEALFGGSYEG